MGRTLTARSDLYSLGAMLYEMVTGRPPFLGDDPVAIISQHLNTPPVAPTWHNRDLPARAGGADPARCWRRTPPSGPHCAPPRCWPQLAAIDLAEAVEPLRVPAPSGAPTRSTGWPAASSSGASGSWATLRAGLDAALSGQAPVRDCWSASRASARRGWRRSWAPTPACAARRCCGAAATSGRARRPTGPGCRSSAPTSTTRDPQGLRSELGAGAADIAEVVSEIRERLPGLPRDADRSRTGAGALPAVRRARHLPAQRRREPSRWCWCSTTCTGRTSPRCCCWSSWRANCAGARLLLLGTYRDVEVGRQHPLSQTLAELSRERRFERIVAARPGREDVGRFIEPTCGITPPAGWSSADLPETEGNPFFVAEVVRLLVPEGG